MELLALDFEEVLGRIPIHDLVELSEVGLEGVADLEGLLIGGGLVGVLLVLLEGLLVVDDLLALHKVDELGEEFIYVYVGWGDTDIEVILLFVLAHTQERLIVGDSIVVGDDVFGVDGVPGVLDLKSKIDEQH